MKSTGSHPLHCSFCRKGEDQVAKLISSPAQGPRSYICDECVAVCNQILAGTPDAPSAAKRSGWFRRLLTHLTHTRHHRAATT